MCLKEQMIYYTISSIKASLCQSVWVFQMLSALQLPSLQLFPSCRLAPPLSGIPIHCPLLFCHKPLVGPDMGKSLLLQALNSWSITSPQVGEKQQDYEHTSVWSYFCCCKLSWKMAMTEKAGLYGHKEKWRTESLDICNLNTTQFWSKVAKWTFASAKMFSIFLLAGSMMIKGTRQHAYVK